MNLKAKQIYVSEQALCRLIKYDEHCSSCHSDEDDGCPSFSELDLGKGRYTEVCCNIAMAYRNWCNGREIDEPKS